MLLPYDTWGQVLFVFIISVLRYLIIGGLAFLFFYVLFKNRSLFAKIQKKWPAKADYLVITPAGGTQGCISWFVCYTVHQHLSKSLN